MNLDWLAFLSVAPLITTPVQTFAQSNSTGVQDVQRNEFKGEVLKIANDKLTVDSNGITKEFTVPNGIRISKNTLESKLSDIQPKDKVTVTYSGNNQVLAVDATSGEVFDYGKFALPAIIIGLLLIGLVIYLARRSQERHIKTTTVSKS